MQLGDWKSNFLQAREAVESNDKKSAATAFAKLAGHAVSTRRWVRALFFLKLAQKYLPESAKIFLAQAICEWERKHEREARHRIQLLARAILRKKRLEEYEGVIERELRSYVSLRQLFYETVASVERNSAIPFLGLARIARSAGDWQHALRLLSDGLRTKDRESVVLGEIIDIVQNQNLKEMEVQCDRYRAGQLRVDDFCLLLSSQQRKASLETSSDSGQMDLSQMIENLEAELGSEPLPAWDKVGSLLAEFRRRADPVIGSHTKSRIDLALAFFEMRLMSAAKEELQQIPEEEPDFGQVLCLLGQIHFEEGALLAAMESYQKCLRDERFRGPVHNEAEYQLIRIYVKLEDFGKAMIHLRDLEKRISDYRDLRRIRELVANRLGVDVLPEPVKSPHKSGGKKLRRTG